jgi:hypothetical protein
MSVSERLLLSMPDYETRGIKCKHIFAVEYAISRECNCDGSVTVNGADDGPKDSRLTYFQNWIARTRDRHRFLD